MVTFALLVTCMAANLCEGGPAPYMEFRSMETCRSFAISARLRWHDAEVECIRHDPNHSDLADAIAEDARARR